MPYLATRAFGPLEYSTEAVLSFPRGLPGYDAAREFLLLDLPDQAPVLYLQSVDSPDLCFVTLPVRIVDPDYSLWLAPEDEAVLGAGGDRLALAIVTGHEHDPPTANLLAPVVICSSTRRGVQAVRNDRRYSHRHPLFEGTPCW
jgi:flagellar assembly factor FliW